MQSADYVPGVSGWMMGKDIIEINGGPWGPVRIGNLDKAVEPESSEAEPKPFIVVDGVTYISQAEVERCSITKAKLGAMWSMKTELRSGTSYVSGIGIGDAVIMTETSARASADEAMSSRIGDLETRMGSLALETLAIKGAIDAAAALNRK